MALRLKCFSIRAMKRSRVITLVIALIIAAVSYFGNNQTGQSPAPGSQSSNSSTQSGDSIAESSLPKEAKKTLAKIRQGGPFPYDKDGTVFGNREQRLPQNKRGYYREYTVRTPGVKHRGARRIVSGGPSKSPTEFFYTQDHYESFRLIAEEVR